MADPPWLYDLWSEAGEGKAPQAQYDCMPDEEIAALPIERLAATNSACFMWATFPKLPSALAIMQAWGFDYRTGGAWAKQSSTGKKWAFGTGYIFRSASELLLVGVRGEPKWLSKSVRNLWIAPLREHSRKPDCVPADIERLALTPRLELFARAPRDGWTVWGNEVDKFAADFDVI